MEKEEHYTTRRQRCEREGYKAHDQNLLPESANPYPPDSSEFKWWRDGWYDSRYEGYDERIA